MASGSTTSRSRRPRSTRRSSSSRSASASLSQDALINDDKHIFMNKVSVINLNHKDNKFKSPGKEQPGEQGQRRSPGPGLRRQPKHCDPIVGTDCTPIEFVDSANQERALSGVQPVGECTNRGHTSGAYRLRQHRPYAGSSNCAVAEILVVPFQYYY